MKITIKIKRIFAILFILVLFITKYSILYANKHIIDINIPIKESVDKIEILNECFSYAIKEEIKAILSNNIKEEKLEKIINFLKSQNILNSFILYYKEKIIKQTSDFIKKQIIVYLDTLQIKIFLKRLGFYYAPENGWSCSIKTNGFTTEELTLFQDIVSVSNCSSLNSAVSDIYIEITSNPSSRLFWGRIGYKDFMCERTDKNLFSLWESLWEDIIKVSGMQKKFTEGLNLIINSFGNIFEVKRMDKVLKESLNLTVDSIELKRIKIEASGVNGEWKINIFPDKLSSLKKELSNIIIPKSLQFVINKEKK